MSILSYLLKSGLLFCSHTYGIVRQPYATYRTISQKGMFGELLYIAAAVLVYLVVASLYRAPEFRLYLLTKQFLLLAVGAAGGFGLSVALLYFLGKIVSGSGTFKSVCMCWGYSLIATICWFFVTSFLFVLFPPPRTGTIRGISFSFLYLVFSSVLFFWKTELYYLTLRFGMKLTLQKIIFVSLVFVPVICGYAILLYKLGIYRVPFL